MLLRSERNPQGLDLPTLARQLHMELQGEALTDCLDRDPYFLQIIGLVIQLEGLASILQARRTVTVLPDPRRGRGLNVVS